MFIKQYNILTLYNEEDSFKAKTQEKEGKVQTDNNEIMKFLPNSQDLRISGGGLRPTSTVTDLQCCLEVDVIGKNKHLLPQIFNGISFCTNM